MGPDFLNGKAQDKVINNILCFFIIRPPKEHISSGANITKISRKSFQKILLRFSIKLSDEIFSSWVGKFAK